ncbi:MAG: diheme cytochrome c [Burkholderiales bacterium]|nr:diheme cytochrome c [Burkholderiales bacterium]
MNNARKRLVFDVVVWSASLMFVFGLVTSEAMADSKRSFATNEKWKAECGSCHIAYQPNLLPASAWRRIMAGLDKHFGTDASLDAASSAEIGAFLERNAGSGKRAASVPASLRITDTRWFVRKHDEVPRAAWKNPQVKTAANCSACHSGAERGDFDEDAVRIPR